MPTVAITPDARISVPLVRLPSPAGRGALRTAPAPQGDELSQLARQAGAEAQRILLGLGGGPAPVAPVPEPDILDTLVAEAQSVRADVANASKLEQSLPLVILAVGILMGRALLGALLALGFYAYSHRGAALVAPPASTRQGQG